MTGFHTYKELGMESYPTGASIWIDGQSFGITPQAIRVDNEHPRIQVILRKPGYLEASKDVDLSDDAEVIHVDLAPRD